MPRPPKRTLTFTITIEAQHDALIGRRERNQLHNVLTNSFGSYLHEHKIPYTMLDTTAPTNEEIDAFNNTHSYTAPDWTAIALEEMAQQEGEIIYMNMESYQWHTT
jgi:hypothetical protein